MSNHPDGPAGPAPYRQKLFLDFHHHLINPRLYTAQMIAQRDRALFEAQWKKNTREPENV